MTVSFNKQRNRWVYNFRSDGTRHQGYCLDATGQPVTSKSAARQAEGVARRLVKIAPKLPSASDISIGQVVAGMLPEWQRQADWTNKQRNSREIVQFFGSATPISLIDDEGCRRYIEYCRSQPIRVWKGAQSKPRDTEDAAAFWKDTGRTRSNGTVNRRLAVLRLILDRAATMRDPLTGRPILERAPTFKDLDEPKRNARPTPDPVICRLHQILPQHTIDAMVISLYFGFRRGEAFSLKEKNCSWHEDGVRLTHDSVKEKKDAFLPGSQEAMGYLRCLAMEAEQRGVKTLISFRLHDSTPWRSIKSSRTAWGNAMEIIEKEFGYRWRWHDLRAAFITHIAIELGPMAAKDMARHSDFDTTQAYIDVANDVKRRAAQVAASRPALRVVGCN